MEGCFLATLPFAEILLKLKEAGGYQTYCFLGRHRDKPHTNNSINILLMTAKKTSALGAQISGARVVPLHTETARLLGGGAQGRTLALIYAQLSYWSKYAKWKGSNNRKFFFKSAKELSTELGSNPLYPRPSGGAGAEGLKKQILINQSNPLYPRPSGGAGAEGLKKQILINRTPSIPGPPVGRVRKG